MHKKGRNMSRENDKRDALQDAKDRASMLRLTEMALGDFPQEMDTRERLRKLLDARSEYIVPDNLSPMFKSLVLGATTLVSVTMSLSSISDDEVEQKVVGDINAHRTLHLVQFGSVTSLLDGIIALMMSGALNVSADDMKSSMWAQAVVRTTQKIGKACGTDDTQFNPNM